MKELEDSKYFPRVLRKCQLQYIGHLVIWLSFYKGVQHVITSAILKKNYLQWVDLCSGSTQPALHLYKKLLPNIPISYTDKFPIYEHVQQQDVLTMPVQENHFYTMFNSFHHFNNTTQKRILNTFATTTSGFLIAEVLEPTIGCFIKVLFASTIGMWLSTPFMKAISIWQIIFTYIIPINVFTVCIDGCISVYKALPQKRMQQLANECSTKGYTITVTKFKSSLFGKILILQGHATG
jgi:hypothetical protein